MSTVSPDIAGPFLLGYLFNYGLYGVLTVQTYIYYNAFPNDHAASQVIVYGVYIVETVQTIMVTWDAFQNFTFGFGEPEALDKMNLMWFDCCLIDGAVAFVVQAYFAYRIYLLSKSRILTGVILLMALAQFGGAVATAALAEIVGLFSKIRERTFVAACFWLGGSAACDIVIAISMIYALSRFDTGFKDTRDLLRRIIRLTMETGSLTAAVATVDLILFLVFPESPFHITAALILAKVYSNSLLVIFNSRVRFLGGRGQVSSSGHGIITSDGGLDLESRMTGSGKFDLSTRKGRWHRHRSGMNVGSRREMEMDVPEGPRRVRRSSVELHVHPIHLNELESKEELQERTHDDDSMATRSPSIVEISERS